jgi:ketosteroid isomerase-like protein
MVPFSTSNRKFRFKGGPPVKSMKHIVLALVAISSLLVLPAWSQGENPPATTKESGATSGHGMTPVEQTAKGGGNVEQQINTLTDHVVQALLKGDTSFLEKYYADDAMIIRGGDQSTKAKEIEAFKSGANKFETYDVHERKIHAYGETAVANMEASAKGSVNGHPFSGDYYVTRVWVKQKGYWKLVLYQVTPKAGASH